MPHNEVQSITGYPTDKEVIMFKKGSYVICGVNGICQVESVTTLDFEWVDKNQKFYLLRPVFSNESTVYKPVDSTELRPALTKEEANDLINTMKDIETIPIADEKTLEKTYKDLIHSCDPVCLVKLIKTLLLRKENRLLKGFKVTALDARYFKLAEDHLYGELSVALDIPKSEMREFVLSHL